MLQEEVIEKAGIKHARPGQQHGLWWILCHSRRCPRETEPRAKSAWSLKLSWVGFETKTVNLELDVWTSLQSSWKYGPGIEIGHVGQCAAGMTDHSWSRHLRGRWRFADLAWVFQRPSN